MSFSLSMLWLLLPQAAVHDNMRGENHLLSASYTVLIDRASQVYEQGRFSLNRHYIDGTLLRRSYQMIVRLWRGWTSIENADAYEKLLREQVLPGLQRIDGYRGGHILRQENNNEVEFVVMNFFDSLESVRAFAGPDYTVPVFEPEARLLLSKVEPVARHYEVVFSL
jgi:hypothetical protein